MGGETDLAALLSSLRPRLSETEFAFGVVGDDAPLPQGVVPWATIREDEGTTVIAPAAALAESGIEHAVGWARITLEVHSSLEAVGLTAALARALTAEGISANVVAAFHHDHVFVPWDRRLDAVRALERLASGGGD